MRRLTLLDGIPVLWCGMEIQLTPEQVSWLEGRVASGEFDSAEEAVRRLLDDLMAEAVPDDPDLDWAKPYIDEALESVARGEVIPLETHQARTAAFLAKLRGR